jgi:hypothetical protein
VCLQEKIEHTKTLGLLQPFEVPQEAWHTVSLDFIEGLSMSGRYDTILVVIDKFTKYGHFLPLKHQFTVATVDNVYKFHSVLIRL